MSNFQRCTSCGEYGFINDPFPYLNHKCKPKWECYLEGGDNEWEPTYADDAERAAEKYAEHYDCEGGEYSIVSGRHTSPVIRVRKPDDAEYQRFFIEAETVPSYRAGKINEASED